jgi:predicted MFS family arabinose efflux permease
VSFVSSASVGFSLAGLVVAWITPTILMLHAADSPISVSADEESWMVSILSAGSVFRVIRLTYIRNVVSRNTILIFTTAPYFIAWFTIIYAVSLKALYISRFLIGLQIIIVLSVTPVHLRVSEVQIRKIVSSVV